jgi:hypothetical protein
MTTIPYTIPDYETESVDLYFHTMQRWAEPPDELHRLYEHETYA